MEIRVINENDSIEFEKYMNRYLKELVKEQKEVIRILYRGFIENRINHEDSCTYKNNVYEAIIEFEEKESE